MEPGLFEDTFHNSLGKAIGPSMEVLSQNASLIKRDSSNSVSESRFRYGKKILIKE